MVPRNEHGFAITALHRNRKESTNHIKITVFRQNLVITPATSVLVTGGAAGILLHAVCGIDRNVLPVPIAADHHGILEGGEERAQPLSLVREAGVGVVVRLVLFYPSLQFFQNVINVYIDPVLIHPFNRCDEYTIDKNAEMEMIPPSHPSGTGMGNGGTLVNYLIQGGVDSTQM